MTFDLDDAIEQLLPWELELTINRRPFKTRRPTMAELGQLLALKEVASEQSLQLLGNLLEPPVNIRKFTGAQVTALVTAYLSYFRSRALKNPLAIATQMRAAIAQHEVTAAESSTQPPSANS